MARPSDREYQLKRKVKELEEQNHKLETEVTQLRKKIEKLEKKDEEYKPKPGKKIERVCPSCGKSIKDTVLPFGRLVLCSDGCGWREVKHDIN